MAAQWPSTRQQPQLVCEQPDGGRNLPVLASSSGTPADFGIGPAVTSADVGGDGDTMPTPAPFLVDPADSDQLLIGTCRVWRGPANGTGWNASNAISPVLDSGAIGVPCNGDGLIRVMAAELLPSGSEVIYVGTYGAASNGTNLGSSSHLMKNGQSFGIFVLIWDLGGIDDTQT